MKLADVRTKAFAMPLNDPAYPRGPYKFYNREFVVITYRTEADALREVVPEPLEVAGVRYYCEDITLKGAWSGPAAIELFEHSLCDVARLAGRGVGCASHYVTDLSLGLGEVVFDYLA